jgi:hypothetical protein
VWLPSFWQRVSNILDCQLVWLPPKVAPRPREKEQDPYSR